MKDIRQRLLAAFAIEHREHLAAIRALLPSMGGSLTIKESDLIEICRRAHSLKGAARAVDLRSVEALAHRLETLFIHLQKAASVLDANLLGVIHQALDHIEDLAAMGEGDSKPPPDLDLLDRVLGIESGIVKPVVKESFTSIPAPSIEKTLPPPTAIPQGSVEETVRIPAASLDQLLRTSGELSAELAQQSTIMGPRTRGFHCALRELSHEWEQFRRSNQTSLRQLAATRQFKRIVAQIDHIGMRLGELVHQNGEIGKSAEQSIWNSRQLTARLCSDVQKARMVPAEHVFGGFRKMVRDLARDQGKQVEVQVQGLEVEADRLVLQVLKDPVMHVLRNAVGHGVELPNERIACNKPIEAHVTMTLVARGGRLVVTVTDDGRGIDYPRIVEVAIERGLMSEEAALSASRDVLHRLLPRAGFSTTTTVDTVSGRGVGLSVLQEAITRLGGNFDLRPNPTGGTQVEISAPLTVAFQHLLLVGCGGHTYGLPSYMVDHLYRLTPQEIITAEGQLAMSVNGQPVHLVALERLLGVHREIDTTHPLWIVLLHIGEQHLAIIVDTLYQVREYLLNDPLKGSDPVVLGTFLLDTGRVAFALDPTILLHSMMEDRDASSRITVRTTAPPSRTILVVDDSVTTRTLEKGILETRGFLVRLAVDGQDALDELRRTPVDLIISDVEMPRMNGLSLLQTLKQEPSLRKIPVILVTSHDRPEEVQHGLDLGADAYIVKQRFEQEELLSTIEQLL